MWAPSCDGRRALVVGRIGGRGRSRGSWGHEKSGGSSDSGDDEGRFTAAAACGRPWKGGGARGKRRGIFDGGEASAAGIEHDESSEEAEDRGGRRRKRVELSDPAVGLERV